MKHWHSIKKILMLFPAKTKLHINFEKHYFENWITPV